MNPGITIGRWKTVSIFLCVFSVSVSTFVTTDSTLKTSPYLHQKTINGKGCVTPCIKSNYDFYHCQTGSNAFVGKCSPRERSTMTDVDCTGPVETDIYDHSWCLTNTTQEWDYAGPTVSESEHPVLVRQHRTISGEYCTSECRKYSRKHFCYTIKKKVQECSPSQMSITGTSCTNECKKNSTTSKFECITTAETEACGPTRVSLETQYTNEGSKCVTPCTFAGAPTNSTASWCADATGQKKECSIISENFNVPTEISSRKGFEWLSGEQITHAVNLGDNEASREIWVVEKAKDDVMLQNINVAEEVNSVLRHWANGTRFAFEEGITEKRSLFSLQDGNLNLYQVCYQQSQCNYIRFTVALRSPKTNNHEKRIAKVEVPVKVVREMPELVETAILTSAILHQRISIHVKAYEFVGGNKILKPDSRAHSTSATTPRSSITTLRST